MQNKDFVYFLSVKQAQEIAKKHDDEPEWDIWTDAEAKAKGMNNTARKAS